MSLLYHEAVIFSVLSAYGLLGSVM